MASYNGLFFIKIEAEDATDPRVASKQDEKYFKGEFVNKVVEYVQDLFCVAVWDHTVYYVLNRR